MNMVKADCDDASKRQILHSDAGVEMPSVQAPLPPSGAGGAKPKRLPTSGQQDVSDYTHF